MFLESLILQRLYITWMMASQYKRAIIMGNNAVDLLKGGPVYYPKACSTRKGRTFEEYLKLFRANKRALKSAYHVII